MREDGTYTHEEVKMLVDFHRAYPDPQAPEPEMFTLLCVICGVPLTTTADDLQTMMETQPFAPCGCRWSNVR